MLVLKRGAQIARRWFSLDKLVFYSLVAVTALLPSFAANDYVLHVFIVACVFGVLAASWDLVAGYAGQLTFGHAGFFGLGAYTSALAALHLGISPWWGLLLGGLTAAALGFVVGLPSLRLRGPYLALTTLAFSETLRIIAEDWGDLTRGPRGLIGYPTFPGVPQSNTTILYLALALLVGSVAVIDVLTHSRVGLALRAVREDETLAQAHGLNVAFYKLLAFVVSSFFAGLAGSFYAHFLLIVTPDQMGAMVTARVVAMAALGGLGTTTGPVIGAFLLELGSEYLRRFGVIYNLILVGAAIIAVIMFAPGGLFGRRDAGGGWAALAGRARRWWAARRTGAGAAPGPGEDQPPERPHDAPAEPVAGAVITKETERS